MKTKRKEARLAHEMSIIRFTCSVTVNKCVYTIIHTENLNNISLIIICTDFWPLIGERDAIHIQNLMKFIMLEAIR